MEEAFAAAAKLPEQEQEALAEWVLEELSEEHQWMQTFTGSQNVLSQLSDEATSEYHAGKTRPLDPERFVKSRTTARFRDAFAQLPPPIRTQARRAYQRFKPKSPTPRPQIQESSRYQTGVFRPNQSRLSCGRRTD